MGISVIKITHLETMSSDAFWGKTHCENVFEIAKHDKFLKAHFTYLNRVNGSTEPQFAAKGLFTCLSFYLL